MITYIGYPTELVHSNFQLELYLEICKALMADGDLFKKKS